METLTKFKGVGKELLAWCPNCKKWDYDVGMDENCHPYNRDIIYCPYCKTGLIRSEPTCMNPHINRTCDDTCDIYSACKAKSG